MKKRKLKKKSILIIAIIFLVLIILLISILFKKKITTNSSIIGTWTTDGITIYKFNKDKTGALILPLNEYPFTYNNKDNSLEIDFKNKKVKDAKYTYSFENNKLILEGENGTFTFIKKDEKKKKNK